MCAPCVKTLFLKFITCPTGSDWVQLSLQLFSVFCQSLHGFFYKLITVKWLMLSCWPLFNTEAVFSFFELALDLLVEVSVAFTGVCSISVSRKCFLVFFISSCSSFTFRLCLSSFFMFEIHNFLAEYSAVYWIGWMGLVSEFFSVCLGCCCGRFCRF